MVTNENVTSAETPKRRGASTAVVVVAAALAATAAFAAGRLLPRSDPPAAPVAEAPVAAWHCPMHPSVVQDHPGSCPICGMKLVQVEQPAAPPRGGDRKILFYRSPMNPQQTSPVARKDEMGMDYVPVYADEAEGEAPVEGRTTVTIDPQRQQLIGLVTAEVRLGTVGTAWRSPARVGVDETRVRQVNVKVAGFVEKVFADFVGKPVRRGEPLFTLYSPELYSAQQEYLLALRTRAALAQGGTLTKNGDDLVASSRRRLKLWDVSDAQLERLERTGEVQRALTVYAPVSGVVTRKDVVEGARLDAGATPYELVDLSQLWVLADVHESELRLLKVGAPATLTFNAFPDRSFEGRVAFVDPRMDPATRTVKARITIANKTGELRPEMFGEVALRSGAREALRIPMDAVVHAGTREIVFVALGDWKFEPREVELGERDGAWVEVTKGVAGGERVITRANFLIDSESRLRASLSAMSGTSAGAGGSGGGGRAP